VAQERRESIEWYGDHGKETQTTEKNQEADPGEEAGE
jgi:hypothetical protein